MNGREEQFIRNPFAGTTGKPFAAHKLVRGVLFIPAIAAFIVLLYLAIGHEPLSRTWTHFIAASIYSAFIGVPSTIVVTWVTIRNYERFGKYIFLLDAAILAAIAVLGCLCASAVLQFTPIVPRGEFWREVRTSLPFAILITLAIGLTMLTYETLRHKLQFTMLELRTRQMEQERAYKLLAEARLSSLESRIHPHFLFNTLNSISALIPTDPRRAEVTVGKLASLLRFSLNANQTGLVPLSQEVKIVRDYLEIESTRFGSRLRFHIDVPEDLQSLLTPPLALQSLVENAIKHVVSKRPDGAAIRIAAVRHADSARVEVIDDGPGFSLEAITPEHGLGNLIARLELLFGDRAHLAVERRNSETVVSLTLPLE